MRKNYFFEMIKSLRESEEVVLYQNILKISAKEKALVVDFLRKAYEEEVHTYPHLAPTFDSKAALYAAEVVYLTAQLILYRKDGIADLEALFSQEQLELTASNILSVDLCLRFVPDMLVELKMIDPEDGLIHVLEELLKKWHYSAVNYEQEVETLNFDIIINNPCLKQLYLNRIVLRKNKKLAGLKQFNSAIQGNLGIHTQEFWSDFKLNEENEQ